MRGYRRREEAVAGLRAAVWVREEAVVGLRAAVLVREEAVVGLRAANSQSLSNRLCGC